MVIITDEQILSAHDYKIFEHLGCIQIIEDGFIRNIKFDNEKMAKTALQLIKEEVKRQSSSCRCEIVIDIDEISSMVEKGK